MIDMEILNHIPEGFTKFILVLIFSLLIGLEQRRHHINESEDQLFGTDRTFTFIGLLAYVLFIADQVNYIPFLIGFVLIGILLGIQYNHKISQNGKYGLTSTILALLTYCIPIMVFTQPVWLVLLFIVAILILTELKSHFITITKKASEEEFITLAKFITFSGVILPLLPETNISAQIPISPYHLWLSIVVVSGISYCSYLLKKFVFPDSGIMLTGLLGGIYSSTATTVILARKEKQGLAGSQTVSAIMIANGMMYLRILFLAFIFNGPVAKLLTIPFLSMFLVSFILSKLSSKKKSNRLADPDSENNLASTKNPLEFKTAAIFGILFVVFALITDFVMKTYGSTGITSLAYMVGITDIDPFLLNLLQQKDGIGQMTVVLAIINATNSNNLLKMIYAISLGSINIRRSLIVNFSILIGAGMLISIIYYIL
ncbi:glutamate synthase [NADPH] large chain [Aquipluma nitroreducens]|uniref:Glutamate synthase [NADPH] large chain n=2 Tax=Aquipluma nitroreducens TaxID=2010828 RepID=A0A5K7S632_9BACT|nr:glutamate synthase [NADPH] large chain [Aquipluma nitroreducens]